MKCPVCGSENVSKARDLRHCNYCFFTFVVDNNNRIQEPTNRDKELAEEHGWTIRTREELIGIVIDLAVEQLADRLVDFLKEFGVNIQTILAEAIYKQLDEMEYIDLFKTTKEAVTILAHREVYET